MIRPDVAELCARANAWCKVAEGIIKHIDFSNSKGPEGFRCYVLMEKAEGWVVEGNYRRAQDCVDEAEKIAARRKTLVDFLIDGYQKLISECHYRVRCGFDEKQYEDKYLERISQLRSESGS